MDGIIQVEYDQYRTRRSLPHQDVRLMTQAEGDDIYLNNYWLPYCPLLPAGLDMEFFDAAVNEGVVESVKILQYALGIANDGKWGAHTDAAVQSITSVKTAILAFAHRRLAVYEETSGFTRFGADWTRRTSEIEAASLKMVT